MNESDWRRFVRERIGNRLPASAPAEEVIEELAEHLEDVYQDTLRRGLPPEAAVARAKEQASDWKLLARNIRRARRKEDFVSHTARTIWVPGTSTLLIASLFGLAVTRSMGALWADPRAASVLAGSWLCFYLMLGALGAYWSRRAGGARMSRLFSGVFPATLHLATFLVIAIAAVLLRLPWSSDYSDLRFLARVFLAWVIIPGAALALGTLPFLRERAAKALRPAL